ncbi:hypothetical protein PBY51_004647 [Eleginops maclovinus]|uniref:Uncharacterized protein n=1 Tax=Eleginops maclovinus TaxID=56733 RepID=A0AAN7Y6K8_ELEMC|nr:hypothetical protein PBY51_004647 [Eleginops maclovinus]
MTGRWKRRVPDVSGHYDLNTEGQENRLTDPVSLHHLVTMNTHFTSRGLFDNGGLWMGGAPMCSSAVKREAERTSSREQLLDPHSLRLADSTVLLLRVGYQVQGQVQGSGSGPGFRVGYQVQSRVPGQVQGSGSAAAAELLTVCRTSCSTPQDPPSGPPTANGWSYSSSL